MSLVLDEHRHYLADPHRLEAFRAALRAIVRPGDVVLDLACGTGILGFLACDAGAARVYAVDDGPIIDLARRFAAANGYADRVTCIREVSTRVVLPEPVDVVVCDQVGNLGIEAGAFEYLLDASQRLLKQGGRVVPGALTFMAAPVESEDVRGRVAFWNSRPEDLDVSSAGEIARNTGYPALVEAGQLLASPQRVATTSLPQAHPGPIRGTASFTIARRGVLDAIGAWFVAELAPGISMTNAPGRSDRIDRRQVLLPLDAPAPVEPGDVVSVELSMLAPTSVVNWRVSVVPHDGSPSRVRSSSHSTFRGMLVSAEDLARTDPESTPSLTPAGIARRTVLELCDGARSLRDIEQAVYARHRDLFPSLGEASAFVAEVVTRYAVADAAVPHRGSHPR